VGARRRYDEGQPRRDRNGVMGRELVDCGTFVQSATAELKRFADGAGGLHFTPLKYGFWIRDTQGRGLFQGNYAVDWLRPFMPDVQPGELARLRRQQPVRYKNRYQDGYRFYIKDAEDLEIAEAIIRERCDDG
jgi:hypothetical protein